MEGQKTDRKRRLAGTHSRVRLRLASDEGLVASIRRGDARAFEALYDRHSGELLSFCSYMLASRADAEDALQATFAAAYRALSGDERPITLRPWLFAIARNQCLTILRRRRPTVELDGEHATHGDPARELELREEVRDTLVRLRELPERQRAAMVLAELRGFSQAEIGTVLGVRAEQVKALVYQARADLISDRRARETDCDQIREEISSAHGAALLRGRLRRHVRSCEDCRTFAAGVARQRRQLNSLFPFAPSLLLKLRALQEALAGGVSEPTAYAGGATLSGTVAGAALAFAGGGAKAIAVKVVAGAAMLGLSTSVGASVAPNQPITRLAADFAHVSGAGARGAGGRAAHGGLAHALLAADGRPGRGAGAGGYALGGHGGGGGGGGGTSEGRGSSERASGGSGDGGRGSAGAGGGASHSGQGDHARKGAHQTGAPGGATARGGQAEQREQARAGRELKHSEHQQRYEEGLSVREARRQASEARRDSAPERARAAEERQREQEQRRREGERGKHGSERQRSAAQRQREREKAGHERERERAGEQSQHQRERNRRERERERGTSRSGRRRARTEAPPE